MPSCTAVGGLGASVAILARMCHGLPDSIPTSNAPLVRVSKVCHFRAAADVLAPASRRVVRTSWRHFVLWAAHAYATTCARHASSQQRWPFSLRHQGVWCELLCDFRCGPAGAWALMQRLVRGRRRSTVPPTSLRNQLSRAMNYLGSMPRIQTVGCAWTSQAAWLSIEPDLFWGFCGQCFNDYRETSPHEGYEIINRWAQRFRESLVSQSIRKRLAERSPAQLDGQLEPYQVTDLPGAFYAFTSLPLLRISLGGHLARRRL